VAPEEEAAGKEVDHSQDTDMGVAGDKDQDVEAAAAGSCQLEDQDDIDRPGERHPSERVSFFMQMLVYIIDCKPTGY